MQPLCHDVILKERAKGPLRGTKGQHFIFRIKMLLQVYKKLTTSHKVGVNLLKTQFLRVRVFIPVSLRKTLSELQQCQESFLQSCLHLRPLNHNQERSDSQSKYHPHGQTRSVRAAVAVTCVSTPDWICSGCAAGAWGTIGTALSILTGNPECFVVACSPAAENTTTVKVLCEVCALFGAFLFLAFLFK